MLPNSPMRETLTKGGELTSEFPNKKLPKRIFKYQPMYSIKSSERSIKLFRYSIELNQETLSRFRVKRIEANRWKFVANIWDRNLVILKKALKSAKTKRIFQLNYESPV